MEPYVLFCLVDAPAAEALDAEHGDVGVVVIAAEFIACLVFRFAALEAVALEMQLFCHQAVLPETGFSWGLIQFSNIVLHWSRTFCFVRLQFF